MRTTRWLYHGEKKFCTCFSDVLSGHCVSLIQGGNHASDFMESKSSTPLYHHENNVIVSLAENGLLDDNVDWIVHLTRL